MGLRTIPARDVCRFFDDPRYVIIDIRDQEDFDKGHIPFAVNMPYDDLEDVEEFTLPKDKIYVLYCERGGSSLLLGRRLDRCGYNVLSLCGGILSYRGKLI